jgi:hypothetical protein
MTSTLKDRMQRIDALQLMRDGLLQEIHDNPPPAPAAFRASAPADRIAWCEDRMVLHQALLYTMRQLDITFHEVALLMYGHAPPPDRAGFNDVLDAARRALDAVERDMHEGELQDAPRTS